MLELNTTYLGDCLDIMTYIDDKSVDIIFTDPPYALGSEVIIRNDGKPDYKKAVDFMSKWEQPDGRFWEKWFIEAFRILKYGGRIIMFGMDRQLMLNKYYACSAGFIEQQSLYWYFISNFPKASDLSKMIDNNAGVEREVVGKSKLARGKSGGDDKVYNAGFNLGHDDITVPTTDLAKKYDGYKYSIAPLKQTNETIMVFQKPYKTDSCLHDMFAYENGDKECLCGALNINDNRVDFINEEDKQESTLKNQHEDFGTLPMTGNNAYGDFSMCQPKNYNPTGRYPAQTFIDTETANILDKQSGILTSGDKSPHENKTTSEFTQNHSKISINYFKGDSGGSSRILQHCNYDENDYDIYNYCPKVSPSERGEGNNHPTIKPISLFNKILKLFKTPNEQVVLDPFMGSGTAGIVCKQLDIGFIGIEKDTHYFDIANNRIKINSVAIPDTKIINEFFEF